MIVGETIRISRAAVQDDGSAFTATNPAAVVTQPDGTPLTPAPIVTATPGTSSTSQSLSFLLTPGQGGSYRIRWSYQDGNGETIYLVDTRFAAWTDAFSLVRSRLQQTTAVLPDSALEPEAARIALRYLMRYPVIGNGLGTSATVGVYNAITAQSDQANFDEAVALGVCCRLIGPLTTGGGTSDVIQDRYGDEQTRYADVGKDRSAQLLAPGDLGAGPGGYAGQSERERWYREAAECLYRVSWVNQETAGAAGSFRIFTVSGPTRAAKASGAVPTLMSEIVRLLTDDWYEDQEFYGTTMPEP